MNNSLDRVIAFTQVILLGLWEALGILAFGWNPCVIAAVWFVSLWTFNICIASGISTYIKLTTPAKPKNVVNLHAAGDPPTITPEDIGG